jgi:hypothetical protein
MSDTKHTDSQLAMLTGTEDQAARPPVMRVTLPSQGSTARQFKVLQSRGAPGQHALPLMGGTTKGFRTS